MKINAYQNTIFRKEQNYISNDKTNLKETIQLIKLWLKSTKTFKSFLENGMPNEIEKKTKIVRDEVRKPLKIFEKKKKKRTKFFCTDTKS